MHKLLIFITLIVFSAVNAFGQHFRNYNSEYVVFTEQIDSSLLKKQLQQHELKIKKLFSKRNHHLGKDSIRGIIENTFFYYVSCYEIAEEKEDTIYLKPYKKQLIKYFKLIHNDLEIGCFGDLGNLSEKGRYGSTYFEVIDKPGLKFSYSDMAYSGFDLYFFEHLFEKKLFAIKDYVENNYQYDFFWFYVNKQGRLEKINNTEIKF